MSYRWYSLKKDTIEGKIVQLSRVRAIDMGRRFKEGYCGTIVKKIVVLHTSGIHEKQT